MRYVLAAVSLVLSLVLLGLGVAQRTIWAPPDTIVSQLEEAADVPVLVLGGDVMNAHDGRQAVVVRGEGQVTAVVGRDHDVEGWVGESAHGTVTIDASDQLELERSGGDDAELPALAGNDMWIEEHVGDGEVRFAVDLPVGYSIAIAGEPGAAAPADVRVEWPFDAKTPLFGPLITAGLVLLALALLLFLLALRSHRRRRGPQRRSHRELSRAERRALQRDAREGLPRPQRAIEAGAAEPVEEQRRADAGQAAPEPAEPGASEPASERPASDVDAPSAGAERRERPGAAERRAARPTLRRRLALVALPAAAVVALTGCGPQYWPSAAPSTTEAEPTPTSLEDTLPPVAVTENQFTRILEDTREVAASADESLDGDAASRRLGGPMLDARRTNYEVRSADGELPAATGIPDGEIELLLPQQTETWPRTVLAVVGWQDDTQTQAALMFEQASARTNYRLVYQTSLVSGVQLPPVASPTIGAASLPQDTPLLQQRPSQVTMAYADFLLRGQDSEYAAWFADEDPLDAVIGRTFKDEQIAKPEFELSNLEWSAAEDEQPPLLLVTNDGGVLLATSYVEKQRTTPKEEGVTISAGAGAGILSGVEDSESGIETQYQVQLLLSIPPADAPEGARVQVVGYSQALLAAREMGR